MLHEEVALYEKLTGQNANDVSITKIGAYLDGYEKGLSVLEDIKADMVAMLTEIQTEIEEKASAEGDWIFAEGERVGSKLIQQKIDALKEVVEDGK